MEEVNIIQMITTMGILSMMTGRSEVFQCFLVAYEEETLFFVHSNRAPGSSLGLFKDAYPDNEQHSLPRYAVVFEFPK